MKKTISIIGMCLACLAVYGFGGNIVYPVYTLTDEDRAELNKVIDEYKALETNRPKYIVQSPDEIRALCAAGEVCRVIGHVWLSSWIGAYYAVYYPEGAPQQRTCGICGKIETKTPGEWR
jgi:hypothetical protein